MRLSDPNDPFSFTLLEWAWGLLVIWLLGAGLFQTIQLVYSFIA